MQRHSLNQLLTFFFALTQRSKVKFSWITPTSCYERIHTSGWIRLQMLLISTFINWWDIRMLSGFKKNNSDLSTTFWVFNKRKNTLKSLIPVANARFCRDLLQVKLRPRVRHGSGLFDGMDPCRLSQNPKQVLFIVSHFHSKRLKRTTVFFGL